MEKERRKAVVFLVLGTGMNAFSITQKNDSMKLIFIFAGLAFLSVAITRFLQIRRKQKDKEA